MDKCPECGAEPYPNHGRYSDWQCGSHRTYDGFRQTARCLIRKLEAENAELRRKADAFDWLILTSPYDLLTIEAAMKQEATDAAKT